MSRIFGNSVTLEDLRDVRKSRDISLRAVAKHLGRKVDTVISIEKGRRGPFLVGMREWGEFLGLSSPQIRNLLISCDRHDRRLYEFMVSRYEYLLERQREAMLSKIDDLKSENDELRVTLLSLESIIREG